MNKSRLSSFEEDGEIVTGTIFDLIKLIPSFKFEKAREAGYSDKEILEFLSQKYPLFAEKIKKSRDAGYTNEEIITYLSKKHENGFDWSVYEEPHVTEIIEISWNERIENLSKDYPISFWSFIIIIVFSLLWISILYIWKLVKLVLYQTVYTIAKAIQDGNSINSCKKENKGEANA